MGAQAFQAGPPESGSLCSRPAAPRGLSQRLCAVPGTASASGLWAWGALGILSQRQVPLHFPWNSESRMQQSVHLERRGPGR